MRWLLGLLRFCAVTTEHLVRMAIPFAGLAAYLVVLDHGLIADPSWILLFTALLLFPLVLVQRRAADGLSLVLLLVTGLAGFLLSGELALAVLVTAWVVAACVSGRFVDFLQATLTTLA